MFPLKTMEPDYLSYYAQRKDAIRQRLLDFTSLEEKDIFYELCFCLLTPQSKGKLCWERVTKLKDKDFLKNSFDIYSHIHGIRFHNQKIKRLHNAKIIFPSIIKRLKEEKDAFQLRGWLVENVDGFGYKEASHFLRNIGFRNLAILDRHILRNLKNLNVIAELPTSLTPKRYMDIEDKFRKFSEKAGIHMDELDLLFWSMATGEIFK